MKVLLISLAFLPVLYSGVNSLGIKIQSFKDKNLEESENVKDLVEPFSPIIEGRIAGGSEAAVNQFPYQAALFPHALGGKIFCGGSIISAYYLISAAHCFYE